MSRSGFVMKSGPEFLRLLLKVLLQATESWLVLSFSPKCTESCEIFRFVAHGDTVGPTHFEVDGGRRGIIIWSRQPLFSEQWLAWPDNHPFKSRNPFSFLTSTQWTSRSRTGKNSKSTGSDLQQCFNTLIHLFSLGGCQLQSWIIYYCVFSTSLGVTDADLRHVNAPERLWTACHIWIMLVKRCQTEIIQTCDELKYLHPTWHLLTPIKADFIPASDIQADFTNRCDYRLSRQPEREKQLQLHDHSRYNFSAS